MSDVVNMSGRKIGLKKKKRHTSVRFHGSQRGVRLVQGINLEERPVVREVTHWPVLVT